MSNDNWIEDFDENYFDFDLLNNPDFYRLLHNLERMNSLTNKLGGFNI